MSSLSIKNALCRLNTFFYILMWYVVLHRESFALRPYSHLPNVLCYLVTIKRNNENCWHNTFCTLFFLLASSFQNVLCHLTHFSFYILCIVFKRCLTGLSNRNVLCQFECNFVYLFEHIDWEGLLAIIYYK